MASDRSRTSSDYLDVGLSRVDITKVAGRRANEWALALAASADGRGNHEAAAEITSPAFCHALQAVMDEAKQEVLDAVERALVQEYPCHAKSGPSKE